MKTFLCLFLLLPLAAHSGPQAPEASPSVAVFDFNSEWSVDYHVQITDAGKVFASWVAHDLSLLPPITVVNKEAVEKLQSQRTFSIADSISPAEAKEVGLTLGATTLVTGRMFKSGTEIIIAAKIVSAGTGEALGTAVKGDPKTPFADLVSQLSEQVGQIILLQQGVKQAPWALAKIVGTRKVVSTIIPNMPREDTAGVVSVDGRDIQGGAEQWTQDEPLRPGAHRVVIYCYYGGNPLLYRPVTFDAMPGASYVVVYEGGPPGDRKLWLEDEKTHQQVARLDASPRMGDKDDVTPASNPGGNDEGPFQDNTINNPLNLGPTYGGGPARSEGGGHK
jgi:TolB-like protein